VVAPSRRALCFISLHEQLTKRFRAALDYLFDVCFISATFRQACLRGTDQGWGGPKFGSHGQGSWSSAYFVKNEKPYVWRGIFCEKFKGPYIWSLSVNGAGAKKGRVCGGTADYHCVGSPLDFVVGRCP
jgi:hypothetical protein